MIHTTLSSPIRVFRMGEAGRGSLPSLYNLDLFLGQPIQTVHARIDLFIQRLDALLEGETGILLGRLG